MHKRSAAFIAGCFLAAPTASFANDDAAEFWFNPAASFELDDDTGMEIETAQRFRNVEDGRSDTYFVRLWINQQVDDTFNHHFRKTCRSAHDPEADVAKSKLASRKLPLNRAELRD